MSYSIHTPTSGGKAGKGKNKTSAIQVRQDGFIVKTFRYETSSPASHKKALDKAQRWMGSHE